MSDGKKRISKAPPPINPLKGGTYFAPRINKPPTPNWEEEWNHTPEVHLWQACALSLNIEPHSMKSTGTSWMAPGGGPTFTDESFPSNGVKEKFQRRLRVLIRNIDSQHFSPYIVTGQHPAYHDVRLDEFAAWASEVVKWDNLPPELVALATGPTPQKTHPVDTGKRVTQGLTKPQVLAWPWPGQVNLESLLSDVPQWLTTARVSLGKPGKSGSALWNPAQIAVCLFTEKNVPKLALENHIQTYFPEWMDAWNKAKEMF